MSNTSKISFIQINLEHAKASTTILNKIINESTNTIALIQEHYIYNGKVLRINSKNGNLNYSNCEKPRSCVYVPYTWNSFVLKELNDGDNIAVLVDFHLNGAPKKLVICSSYLPGNSIEPPPSETLRKIVCFCQKFKI